MVQRENIPVREYRPAQRKASMSTNRKWSEVLKIGKSASKCNILVFFMLFIFFQPFCKFEIISKL